jgi:hypothetical protein
LDHLRDLGISTETLNFSAGCILAAVSPHPAARCRWHWPPFPPYFGSPPERSAWHGWIGEMAARDLKIAGLFCFFWLRFANKDDKTLGVEDVEDVESTCLTVLRHAQSEADLYLPSAKSHPQLGPELHIQQLQFDTFLAEARDLPLLVSI